MALPPCLLLLPLLLPCGGPETDFCLHLELGELQIFGKRLSEFIASHTLPPAFGLRMLSSRGSGVEPGGLVDFFFFGLVLPFSLPVFEVELTTL